MVKGIHGICAMSNILVVPTTKDKITVFPVPSWNPKDAITIVETTPPTPITDSSNPPIPSLPPRASVTNIGMINTKG